MNHASIGGVAYVDQSLCFAASEAEPEQRSGSLENPSVSLNDPDAWRETFGLGLDTLAGESVSHLRSLSLSPVWRAVGMISGDVSKLPLEVFRRTQDNGRESDRTHPASLRIRKNGQANEEVTALKLWRRAMVHALLWNNAFIWIDRDPVTGLPAGLYNWLPDRTVPVRRRTDGMLFYETDIGGRLYYAHHDDIIHIEGINAGDGSAPDLVAQARDDFACAIARRRFTSKFFKNGMHAGGVLQAPVGSSKTARDKLEKGIQDKAGGDNAFRIMVLRDGFKFHKTMVDPQQAQMHELRVDDVRDVANWFQLSPDRLGVEDSVSYNSLSERKQDYLDTTLSYWLVAILAECNAKLLTPSQRESDSHFVDYNINALLWTNATDRSTIAVQGIQARRFTINETRAWENLNPVPWGDTFESPPADTNTPADPNANADGNTSGTRHSADAPIVAGELPAWLEQLARDALTRCCRRIHVHAEKASRRGSLDSFAAAFDIDHRAAIQSILLPLETPLPGLTARVLDALTAALQGPADGLAARLESLPAALSIATVSEETEP